MELCLGIGRRNFHGLPSEPIRNELVNATKPVQLKSKEAELSVIPVPRLGFVIAVAI
jgi:hypothetical protein